MSEDSFEDDEMSGLLLGGESRISNRKPTRLCDNMVIMELSPDSRDAIWLPMRSPEDREKYAELIDLDECIKDLNEILMSPRIEMAMTSAKLYQGMAEVMACKSRISSSKMARIFTTKIVRPLLPSRVEPRLPAKRPRLAKINIVQKPPVEPTLNTTSIPQLRRDDGDRTQINRASTQISAFDLSALEANLSENIYQDIENVETPIMQEIPDQIQQHENEVDMTEYINEPIEDPSRQFIDSRPSFEDMYDSFEDLNQQSNDIPQSLEDQPKTYEKAEDSVEITRGRRTRASRAVDTSKRIEDDLISIDSSNYSYAFEKLPERKKLPRRAKTGLLFEFSRAVAPTKRKKSRSKKNSQPVKKRTPNIRTPERAAEVAEVPVSQNITDEVLKVEKSVYEVPEDTIVELHDVENTIVEFPDIDFETPDVEDTIFEVPEIENPALDYNYQDFQDDYELQDQTHIRSFIDETIRISDDLSGDYLDTTFDHIPDDTNLEEYADLKNLDIITFFMHVLANENYRLEQKGSFEDINPIQIRLNFQ